MVGDPVDFASDQPPPDQGGIATSTRENPDRNLSLMARDEYEGDGPARSPPPGPRAG